MVKLESMRTRYPALLPASTPTGEARPSGRLLKFHAPEIVFGIDAMVEAAHAAVRLGALRPMLVTDPGLIEAGWAAEMVRHLEQQFVPLLLHISPEVRIRHYEGVMNIIGSATSNSRDDLILAVAAFFTNSRAAPMPSACLNEHAASTGGITMRGVQA